MQSDISKYLKSLSPLQRKLVEDIREIVLETDAQIQETMKWGSICFTHNGNLCGFRVAKAHATLLFFEGSQLKDPHRLLSGDGAKARTIKHTKGDVLNREGIQDLVRQAMAINA